ncbi:MAG: VOC family protein [Candidatus Cohnella colombiensis]|uniref:VOC family protein n=1 Tax=Candidatus Cohnella colombiensis TaxID=3121368 RepID=A0AA95EX22_9BACL|nr:MAG: VOC family protein [Cohnella sp.]
MQSIVPHLWFDREADEASRFYISLFEGSKIIDRTILNETPSGTSELIIVELAGQQFMLISAGPYFKFTPAISFVIACNTVAEVERLWDKLIEQGQALMPLGAYPFSEKFGWVADRYGLSWQVMYVGEREIKQKITPQLMFVGEQCGNAEEAMRFYTSVFQQSEIGEIRRYGEGALPNKVGTVLQESFMLNQHRFSAIDSAYNHEFQFSEAISFVVKCDTQEEIDYYWDKLSAVPEAEQCGWLKDKYGVSWQIVPAIMGELMQNKDPEKQAKVTEAFLKMKKFDIAELMRI